MLLPWSSVRTLAIAHDGIALRTGGEKPQMLTEAGFQWRAETPLLSLLSQHENSLKNQPIKVVLSNTFVRYLVLPWQDAVFAKADWQAIAQHAFRQQFGAQAGDWRVSVHFQQYGQTVLAAAMNDDVYMQLEAAATALKFNMVRVAPLLMTLLNAHSADAKAIDWALTGWVLVAEPQRLLLCQINQGEWQQVLVDSPPAGQEYQHAEQLIQRAMLTALPTPATKVASYVSASLSKSWQENIGSRQKMIMPVSGAKPHAAWMAGI